MAEHSSGKESAPSQRHVLVQRILVSSSNVSGREEVRQVSEETEMDQRKEWEQEVSKYIEQALN